MRSILGALPISLAAALAAAGAVGIVFLAFNVWA